MKLRLLLIILFLLMCIFNKNNAQENQNVLSYYASDNSIDGQPRIDMVNYLRFFPVFAIRENITEVNVSVFYGGNIFNNKTDKMNGGQYWQTLLPEFKLGDAIQRIEVEMKFKIPNSIQNKILKIENDIDDLNIKSKEVFQQAKNSIRDLKESIENISGIRYPTIVNTFTKSFPEVDEIKGLNRANIFNEIERTLKYKSVFGIAKNDSLLINKFRQLILYSDKLNDLIYLLDFRQNEINELLAVQHKKEELDLYKDSARTDIFTDIIGEYADTSFSGPAIRKSDLIISEDFKSAKLLYRYYKNNLRYRKALDPAENLGIFRARFIPFPITRKPGRSKVEMFVPAQPNSNAVFEIGLSFGDNVVSGDNTFNPGLSISRLGIAIVVSEKLFSESAEILGLALTYDFNSYASIGVGRNLAQGESYPYYSLGINKKAFEQLIGLLAGIFM